MLCENKEARLVSIQRGEESVTKRGEIRGDVAVQTVESGHSTQ